MTRFRGRCRLPTLGIPSLDSDHRCLCRVIDLLVGVEDPQETAMMIATVLAMVSEYAWFHFQREDRVVTHLGAPGGAVRAAEHRAFARLIDDLRSRQGDPGPTLSAATVHAELCTWLCHHILLFDVGLAAQVTDAAATESIARAGAPACLLAPRSSPRRRQPVATGLVAATALPM